MTEHLERIKHKKLAMNPNRQLFHDSKSAPVHEGGKGTACEENMGLAHKKEIRTVKERRTAHNTATGQGTCFGGFQKGFLFGSKSSSASSKDNNTTASSIATATTTSHVKTKLPQSVQGQAIADNVIRPKQPGSKSSSLEFPEVQEAMKASHPFLNTESKFHSYNYSVMTSTLFQV